MLYETQMTCVINAGNQCIYMCHETEVSWLRDQSLKLNDMIIQHPPFCEYDIWQFNTRIIDWGCIQQCITITRSMDSLGQEFLDFLYQASWCHAVMAGSLWLHRSGMGCHRHWGQGIPLNSCHGRNSWSLVHLGCWCCRCNGCGLHAWCSWGQCRLCHWEAVSCQSLQCGSYATWNSVNCFDTAFTEVSLHAAVCGTIAGVYLIAVSW